MYMCIYFEVHIAKRVLFCLKKDLFFLTDKVYYIYKYIYIYIYIYIYMYLYKYKYIYIYTWWVFVILQRAEIICIFIYLMSLCNPQENWNHKLHVAKHLSSTYWYIFMHIYTCRYIYVNIYIYIHTHICIYICAYKYMCIYI